MIPYFNEIGQRIDRLWCRRDYDEEVFPQLALEALEQAPPHRHIEAKEIIDWVFGPHQAFRQPNSPLFGQPPILVFQAPRFYIEALFWLSGTTEIHEHSFSGAFGVLTGSSLHSHWSFTPERVINSRFSRGRLERISTEILRPGSVRTIRSGDRLIHQLFHLEMPSVTIVVRTYEDRNHLPQYKYLLPGLALDPDDRDGRRTRRLVFLEGMASGQLAGLSQYAHALIETGDLETFYYMLSLLTKKQVGNDLLDELCASARERHGDIVDLLRQVCEEERRTRVVTLLRSKISHPEARFLLALLMLMPDREAIFEAVRLERPETEPLVTIEKWIEGISGKDTIGFEFSEINRVILRSLIEGRDAEGLLKDLRSILQEEAIEQRADRLLDHARKMARSDLFRPLFSRSPLLHNCSLAPEPPREVHATETLARSDRSEP